MASIQQKGDAWYCTFSYAGKRKTFTIGDVSEREAGQWKARVDHLLMRIDQNLLTVPAGVDIADFVKGDGKAAPSNEQRRAAMTTLDDLRAGYVGAYSAGGIEKNTLATAAIHFRHLESTYGKRLILAGVSSPMLQLHINRRQKDEVSPITIKKELDTFRTAWNWGMYSGLIAHPFPTKGLVYPKSAEKLPFMTWSEIKRRIDAAGVAAELWECLYLDDKQVAAFLNYAESDKWLYAALVMAAHTGARRSEMARLRIEDVDMKGAVITLREKKRAKGVVTSRRVPMSSLLIKAIAPLLERNAGRAYVFGAGHSPLTPQAMAKAFQVLVEGSKWEVLKGYHVLRHSFISTLANHGTDQRIIDDLVSHSTEQQRRRYRHLFPQVKSQAIKSVFG